MTKDVNYDCTQLNMMEIPIICVNAENTHVRIFLSE